MKIRHMISMLLALILSGCGDTPQQVKTPEEQRPASELLISENVSFLVYQREKIDIPNSPVKATIKLGDITDGQVLITIVTADGQVVLPRKSVSRYDVVDFVYKNGRYQLDITNMHNKLTGRDFCEIRIVIVHGPDTLTEDDKIGLLLNEIAAEQNIIFIRNGKQYTSQQARDHLYNKWQPVKNEIKTAREFINKIATKSSTSNQPYEILLENGKTVSANDWLNKKLNEIENKYESENKIVI